MPDPRIKDEDKYEALRKKGYSKEKSARIANTPDSGEKGGKSKKYEERTKQELYDEAKKEDTGERVLFSDYLKKRKAKNA